MSSNYITPWGTLTFDRTNQGFGQHVWCFLSNHQQCQCQHCSLSQIVSDYMTQGYSVVGWQPIEDQVLEI